MTGLGSIRGRIHAPGIVDFLGASITLFDPTGERTGGHVLATGDGRFAADAVEPGDWVVVCMPSPALPLTNLTYPNRIGFDISRTHAVHVKAGQVVRVDLEPRNAGFVQVDVVDKDTIDPIKKALVFCMTDAGKNFAFEPVPTLPSGLANLANVPLRSRVFAIDPAGRYAPAQWMDAQGDTTLVLRERGAYAHITIPLSRAA